MTLKELARSNYTFFRVTLPLILLEVIESFLDRAERAWKAQCIDKQNGWKTTGNHTQTPLPIPITGDLIYVRIQNRDGHRLFEMQNIPTTSVFRSPVACAIADLGMYGEFGGAENQVCTVSLRDVPGAKLRIHIIRYEARLPDGTFVGTKSPTERVPSETTLERLVLISIKDL